MSKSIELINNLDRDLAKVQCSRDQHVYIQNVLNAYKRQEEQDAEAKR